MAVLDTYCVPLFRLTTTTPALAALLFPALLAFPTRSGSRDMGVPNRHASASCLPCSRLPLHTCCGRFFAATVAASATAFLHWPVFWSLAINISYTTVLLRALHILRCIHKAVMGFQTR